MAMDYPNSQFTVIDVADLLPADFEEATAEDPLDNENNISQFTPMHPNLPQKLQNTTTPVLDSSITLDSNSSFSNVLLSQIEESQGTIDSIISNVQEHTVDPQTNTPKLRRLLSNLDFYQINIVDGKLPFPDNHFDFVKQRLVTASFTLADWKRVMEELVRVTKPGGYIQLLEIDYNTFNLGPNGRAWELQCETSIFCGLHLLTFTSTRNSETKENDGTKNCASFTRFIKIGWFDRCVFKACFYSPWIMGSRSWLSLEAQYGNVCRFLITPTKQVGWCICIRVQTSMA